MTIRRRLILSFLAILALFAANQAIYVWSAHLRTRRMQTLDRALTRQVVLATLRQDLDNLHKQVTLLSQIQFEAGAAGADPETRRLFAEKVDFVAAEIARLKELTEPADRAPLDELSETYTKLAEAWKGFHQYQGVEEGAALTHLIRAEPLSQLVLTDLLPRLQAREKQRVQEAAARFEGVTRLTDRVTLILFALSTVGGLAVAFLLSRHILQGCGELQLGAALLGSGQLEHRINMASHDELAYLAEAFNDMADNLQRARGELVEANRELEHRHQEAEKEHERAELLLHNILPVQVAEELQAKGAVEPKYFDDVTILFADFVGFTLSTEKLAAEELVSRLHDYFTAFDQIITRYGLEKLKTIGDSYMCVGGLPVRTPSHPVDAVLAAFEMVQAVKERDRPDSPVHWAVRLGVHIGPVVAGVVGIRKFAFDIWGDAVNYASRVEASGAPNRINLSVPVYRRVKDFFDCEYRGKVMTKEKIESDMYFANRIHPGLLEDGAPVPPPAFLRRYRAYFQKDPPSFPAFLAESVRVSP